MRKELRIDEEMKKLWPATRVGCLQYRVKEEKKNEDKDRVHMSFGTDP